LGGEIGEGLVRKGVGSLHIMDPDVVELSNLNRQMFGKRDLYRNKAVRLARNLSRMGFGGTRLKGIPTSFERAVETGELGPTRALVCGIDRSASRVNVSRYALSEGIPVIFTAVSTDGNNGMVMVQEPGKACYGCVFKGVPSFLKDPERKRCAPDPAVKDILKVVAGLVLYAVDSLFMDRKRNWNYREVFLSGFVEERVWNVERQSDCPLCGNGSSPERRI
jgi:adenylyltransferase/sulfurtransferase